MEQWLPFELNEEEYRTVILWWQESHPKVIESSLSTESWHDWMQEVLESS
ncbi:hypothetical Protein YC6258_03034 [Gynuella sunshinyii YC6258]|uniref:Uncharacterized protein n=2 Tax=Gynuella sunshinyii TaxID=1445505 RepID=A0A0C5VK56_9GAMM|nr:hypothetical Protein YC6258_03034 [Gynuella sunshinyii YC6258]